VKITIQVCKLTELRSAARRAYADGTVEEAEEALEDLLDHARERYRASDWSSTERKWFDEHPRFIAYMELSDDERLSYVYEDIWSFF
jgi:hypothetical protein